MKVRLPLAVAVAALLGLTACGGDDPAGSGGPVTLRMTTWSANEAHLKLFNEIADQYRKAHPEVTAITFDAIPFESYTTTLTTQVAGGNPPDLAWGAGELGARLRFLRRARAARRQGPERPSGHRASASTRWAT
jgi:multiple sugar transport system substrate-binding protein